MHGIDVDVDGDLRDRLVEQIRGAPDRPVIDSVTKTRLREVLIGAYDDDLEHVLRLAMSPLPSLPVARRILKARADDDLELDPGIAEPPKPAPSIIACAACGLRVRVRPWEPILGDARAYCEPCGMRLAGQLGFNARRLLFEAAVAASARPLTASGEKQPPAGWWVGAPPAALEAGRRREAALVASLRARRRRP